MLGARSPSSNRCSLALNGNVDKMIEQSKETVTEAGDDDYISIDDFMAVDLRIARIAKPSRSKAPTSWSL